LQVLDLGTRDYKEVWDLQKEIHEKRVDNKISNTLILVEHNPVITMGKSGHDGNVLFPVEFLKEKGLNTFRSNAVVMRLITVQANWSGIQSSM
jgi:lipoyl(octanoyl) transferase